MIIWSMRIACWIPKITNTHSEYVIPFDLSLQQCLHERALILRYTYIAFHVKLRSPPVTRKQCSPQPERMRNRGLMTGRDSRFFFSPESPNQLCPTAASYSVGTGYPFPEYKAV
jgi:hypothetical protein